MQNTTSLEHPAEEALERYVLQQSSESEAEIVETHFIACESCIQRLEQVELQISVIKLALRDLHQEKVAGRFAKQQTKRTGWLSLSGLSIAGALATVAITLSVLPATRTRNSPAVNVQLKAYRGLESSVLPRERPLHVTLNADGISGDAASVTLVDSDGLEVWKNLAPIRNNTVAVDVPKIHEAGTHLFRLYAPGNSSQLLREFSVNVE